MPPARFEPLIPARERPQTHALDHEATRIANGDVSEYKFLPFRTGPSKINKLFKTEHPFLPQMLLKINYTDVSKSHADSLFIKRLLNNLKCMYLAYKASMNMY
jgi:hypothetical protein